MFPAVDPDDVAALTACVDWVVEQLRLRPTRGRMTSHHQSQHLPVASVTAMATLRRDVRRGSRARRTVHVRVRRASAATLRLCIYRHPDGEKCRRGAGGRAMRALRVVGITEDGGELSVVLEDPGRRERFTVPADEQLRAAARGDLTRLGQIAIELESQLRPREIQARIRAGASVDQVAAAAGVPEPEDRAVRLPGAAGAVAHGRGRPARAPDAGRRAGHPHARRRRRAHLRPARPGLHRRRMGLLEGRRRRAGSSRCPGGPAARTTARTGRSSPGRTAAPSRRSTSTRSDLVEGLPRGRCAPSAR